ncbi:MAG: xanthine dehydrogenase subunit [Hyphomicrobiales bacterium]|nr:xanthine dehydrogenase subunit [Hyphomicrobiales bacterium]
MAQATGSGLAARTLKELHAGFERRPDADWKVSGQKGFLTDKIPLDALFVKVWRSPTPHGKIVSIDTSIARTLPGVVRVVTFADIPGVNGFGHKVQDQPVLCGDRVRMVGDPVIAIAAATPEQAASAVAACRVDIEPLPVIVDPEEALKEQAFQIYPNGNLCYERRHTSGDIKAAFSGSSFCVSDVYNTGRQFHIAMETEGGFVVPKPDGSLAVHVASHFPHGHRTAIAAIINVDPARIEVTATPM